LRNTHQSGNNQSANQHVDAPLQNSHNGWLCAGFLRISMVQPTSI
jgi:hypothetical protein